jgi:hypothetical protein
MYFKHITLENIGPIESLDFEFPINEDGTPKPVFFVGENGSGKSIVLSHLVNFLVSAKQQAFDNSETDSGKVYKVRSPRYITIGKEYSYSKVTINSDEYQLEWSLNKTASEYNPPPSHSDWSLIRPNESNHFHTSVDADKSKKLFSDGVVLYLPPNRFEEPAWLNTHNLNAKASYTELRNIEGHSDRKIIDYSPLKENQNWLLDVLFDRQAFDMQIHKMPIQLNTPSGPMIQDFENFGGFSGASSSIFNELLKGINMIIQKKRTLRFGVGTRHDRVISIMDAQTNETVVPNLFQLSTGETLLLNLYLSILRDFDFANGSFSRLEDVSGVVIIDEIDMHLHTTFQRTVLPKLIKLFPKIQFIATTHSPLLLLGLEEELGADKISIINLPEGKEISVSSFSEFGVAYEAFKQTQVFMNDLNQAIVSSQKPILYVEGRFDKLYIEKAAQLLQRKNSIENYEIHCAGGSGNLDILWTLIEKTSFSKANLKTMVLLYDFDTKKFHNKIDNKYRRVIPDQGDDHLRKGIENLFPVVTIDRLEKQFPEMIDISGGGRKRGADMPVVKTVNENEKQKMCDELCTSGTKEDFEGFAVIFDMLDEITSENNKNLGVVA